MARLDKTQLGKLKKRSKVVYIGPEQPTGECPLTPLDMGSTYKVIGFTNIEVSGRIKFSDRLDMPIGDYVESADIVVKTKIDEESAPYNHFAIPKD